MSQKRVRLSFLLDWEVKEGAQLATAEDGMWEAIRLLGQEWDIRVHALGSDSVFPHKYFPIHLQSSPQKMADYILSWTPDVVLIWGDFTRPTIPLLTGKVPTALALTGGISLGTPPPVNLFFVESKVYFDILKSWGKNVRTAFGVNDRVFRPIRQPKIFDAVFPATFADWKRHKLFAEATKGMRAFCFGYMYDTHEQWCYEIPQENGVAIAPHIGHEAVAYIINMSKTVLVTSREDGGSQRTVLEAMACNVPVIVMNDSDKTSEYVEEANQLGFKAGVSVQPDAAAIKGVVSASPFNESNGRGYILSKWSARHYADSLKEGLLSICQPKQTK